MIARSVPFIDRRKRWTIELYLVALLGLLVWAIAGLAHRHYTLGSFVVAVVMAGLLHVEIGFRAQAKRRRLGMPPVPYGDWLARHVQTLIVVLAAALMTTLIAYTLAGGHPWGTLAVIVGIELSVGLVSWHRLR